MFDLESLYLSVIKRVQVTIAKARDEGFSDNLEYYSWDARGEASEVETNDLLGLAGWSFRENGGLWEVRSGLVLSTFNDEHLFREIKILNIIHDLWGEGSEIPMYDKTSGEQFTNMVVSDFDMMPAGQSEKRNYRPIGIELLRTSSG